MNGITKDSFQLTRGDIRKYVIAEIFFLLLMIIAGVPFLFYSTLVKVFALCHIMICSLIIILYKLPDTRVSDSEKLLLEISESGVLVMFHTNKKPTRLRMFSWNQIANYSVAVVPDGPLREIAFKPGIDPREMKTFIVIEDTRGGRYYFDIIKGSGVKIGKNYLLLGYILRYNLRKYSPQQVQRRNIDDYDRAQMENICSR